MDLFKRIGTDKHKFKVQFFLKTLACNAKLKGDIYVKIKRGDHKLTSQSKVPLQQDGTCNFGKEILTFQSLTLFFDPDKKAYQQKQGEFTVVIITKKGEKKLLGSFEFDVAQYANSGKENIQVSKKFGEKIKVVLQYDVFIKCMGEASQTSKSIDKPPERKKQSSLSKFTSFFTGNKESPEKEDKKVSPVQKQNIEGKNKKDRENSNPKINTKEVSKVVKNKNQKDNDGGTEGKREERVSSTNLGKRTENTGSERKIAEKPKKRKNDSEDDQDETPEKQSKNLVNIRQKDKDNYTEIEESEREVETKIKKQKTSTPQQEPIYFDQPNKKRQNENYKDKDNDPDYHSNRMKRTENRICNKQPNELPKNQNTKKTKQFSPAEQSQEIEKLSRNVQELVVKNTSLEKQNKQLRTQNLKLIQQNKNLNKKLQQINKNRNNDFYKTERQPANTKVDDEKIRNLEKEKGDLLLKIQKLEEKYKKDFQKYEEKVEQYEEQKSEMQQASKAEIKRLKDQFSEQKDKYDKLMSKYEEKASEGKEFKQRQNDLKEKLAIAQNNLSELKLKIGDQLNEANQEGNKTVIDVLTLLSQ